MSAFWYFLPDVTQTELVVADRLQRPVLARYGLEGVLEDVHVVPDQCVVSEPRNGPRGKTGCLLYPVPVSGEIPAKVGYFPDLQEWRKVNGSAGASPSHPTVPPSPTSRISSPASRPPPPAPYHLGYATESPPRPEELERRELVGGYPVRDQQDREWIVPVLRAVDNPRGRLSAAFAWDENDQPTVGVDPRFADLWERSARVWDLIDNKTEADEGGVMSQAFGARDDAFLFRYLTDCLAVNYRVNNSVLATLDRITPGWLSAHAASWMLNATVDLFKYKQFLEAQKKTKPPSPPPGVNSGPGTTAADPDTAPAEAN